MHSPPLRFRVSAVLALALALASCGGDGGETSTVAVVNAPASTPTPTPTPAPTPTPIPTPTPPASAAVEPYTLGGLTFSMSPDIPADKVAAIRDAMEFAIAHTNAITGFRGNVPVVFGAGTPTADAGFLGQIRFGGLIGRRVALHELAHWLGSGSVEAWPRQIVNGRFTGPLATARIKAFEGPDAFLNADGAHFWPYGLNFDDEFSETQRNTQMVSAQVADMGLGPDAAAVVAGVRRFQNRSAELVLQGAASGSAPIETGNAATPAQQWRVTYADGFVTLVNVETGLALASTGATGDNAATTMAPAASSPRQQWEMMPVGETGWFLLRNRETRNCLDNVGNRAADAPLRLWGCGFHPNQQWRLIR